MSEHMKKHPINAKNANVSWQGASYSIPLQVIEKYKVSNKKNDVLSVNDVFGDLIQESGKPGLLLKGLRHREGLSQVNFAKTIGVTQNNLSAMENGRRTIGKEIAKRIADKFEVDYRIFL